MSKALETFVVLKPHKNNSAFASGSSSPADLEEGLLHSTSDYCDNTHIIPGYRIQFIATFLRQVFEHILFVEHWQTSLAWPYNYSLEAMWVGVVHARVNSCKSAMQQNRHSARI